MQFKTIFVIILALITTSGCTQSEVTSNKDSACRELNIALGTFTDISLKSLTELELDDNAKPLPPSPEIQSLLEDLIESLNAVAENAPSEEIKTISEQFASDVATYYEKAMKQEISLASSAAISDDASQIQKLCTAF